MPPNPPAGALHSKNRRRLLIYGGMAAAMLLVFVLMRRSSAAASSTDTAAPATSATDPTGSLTDSGGSAGGVDDSAELGTIDTDIQTLSGYLASYVQSAQNPGANTPGTTGTTTTDTPTAPVVNVYTTPSQPGPGNTPAVTPTATPTATTRPAVGSSAGPHGAIVAPYGATKPADKAGYNTVGTGSGGWIYVPKTVASAGAALLSTTKKK
jgi:hypothetical protein